LPLRSASPSYDRAVDGARCVIVFVCVREDGRTALKTGPYVPRVVCVACVWRVLCVRRNSKQHRECNISCAAAATQIDTPGCSVCVCVCVVARLRCELAAMHPMVLLIIMIMLMKIMTFAIIIQLMMRMSMTMECALPAEVFRCQSSVITLRTLNILQRVSSA